MEFTLNINMDNDAFVYDSELPWILNGLVEKFVAIGSSPGEASVRDGNGNTVGRWTITPRLTEDEINQLKENQ